jgi:hypothetical protein
MYRFAAVLFAMPLTMAVALDSPNTSTPFEWTPPDESSPFFESNSVFYSQEQKIPAATSPSSQYPLIKNGQQTVSGQVQVFFTNMFASVNFRGVAATREEADLIVTPETPNLADTREVGVNYSIRNNSNRMARLDFSTSQRIEILTKNSGGSTIDRWSDDRSFPTQEDVVVINPDERIEYREKISTRDMNPGQTYEVEAMLKSEPNFRLQKPLAPR